MADKNFLTDIIDADLAEGKIREIHTRFPPEPNGYLHIGSAKAIYINWSIANQYGGKFNLRLDDTNPAREGEEYVNSIIEDLHWLGADPNGGIFYGSDYFDQCYEYAEKLIKEGKAYVDDLSREEMREYRGADAGKPSRPSPYRDRTPEENLDPGEVAFLCEICKSFCCLKNCRVIPFAVLNNLGCSLISYQTAHMITE